MAAWVLVPCLVALRDEFNAVSPRRDKGADGSIGDTAHTSSSDHTPDEVSKALRDHDADAKNEVHALDIDSSGPWPESGWFNRAILALVAREKAEFESATKVGRLSYVIWNRRIAARSNGWKWTSYTLDDPHTNHAHFSARYTTAQENDTRSFGIAGWDDMATKDELKAALKELLIADAEVAAKLKQYAGQGWHGQELFRSDKTAAEVAETTAKDVADLKAKMIPPATTSAK